MGFTTYTNKPNKRVTIHCNGCNQIKKRGGIHKYKQGWYKHHKTYKQAEAYAQLQHGYSKIPCSYCNPPGCTGRF